MLSCLDTPHSILQEVDIQQESKSHTMNVYVPPVKDTYHILNQSVQWNLMEIHVPVIATQFWTDRLNDGQIW